MTSVSIVLTYHNRPDQLRQSIRSLRSFCGQNLPDTEVVIVDDASRSGMEARGVLQDMKFDAKLIEISPEEKTWVNPSVPYNRGFKAATGDIVVIQNAETFYMGNVLSVVRQLVTDANYVVFPCYSTTQHQFHKILEVWGSPQLDWVSNIRRILHPFQSDQWFHHPVHNPVWYHFTTAMARKNLMGIGGFNEIFANGYCFDDNEFLLRIRRSGLQITPVTEDQAYVVHQWHPKNPNLHGGCPLWEKNRQLYLQILEGKR